jgi:hypothetical protein
MHASRQGAGEWRLAGGSRAMRHVSPLAVHSDNSSRGFEVQAATRITRYTDIGLCAGPESN